MNEDRSSRYHRLKRRAALLSLLLTAGLLGGLLLSGASAAMRDWAMAVTGGTAASPTTVGVYAFLLAAFHEAVALPVAFYRSFLLERRYGLSNEPASTWFLDHAKASVLGAGLGIAGAEVVYLTLGVLPQGWWLGSAVALMVAILVLTRITPTVLLPMFYRFTPLDRDALRERLLTLSRRAGVRVLGVYIWGLGAKTRRANAALVGSGGTRRILLSDTLLAEYSDDEIEVILAHELAHQVHHDIPKALVLEFVLLIVSFGMAAAALSSAVGPLGLHAGADVAGLPLLLLAAGATTIVATPFINARSRLNERRADRFALELTKQPDAFVSAMKRLGNQNLVEERPSRFTVWLFHTHPPMEERIQAAKRGTPNLSDH